MTSPEDATTPAAAGRKSRDLAGMVALFVIALAARWAWYEHRQPPLDLDEVEYMAFARNIAEHGQFRFRLDGPLEAHHGPAYPYAAAGLVAAGLSPEIAGRVVSALAGSLAAVLVFPLASRLWGDRWASITAALLAAVHPLGVSISVTVYPEALSSLLLVASALAATFGTAGAAVAGSTLGLAVLNRRESILLFPLLLLWSALRGARPEGSKGADLRLRRLLAAALSFFLVVAPYLGYLRVVAGRWTLSTETNDAWVIGRLMEKSHGEGIPMSEILRVEARYPSAWDYFRAQPLDTVTSLMGSTAFHFHQALFGWRSWPLGIAAIVGTAVAFRRRRWALGIAVAPFLLCAAWSFAGPFQRYSRALAPFVAVLAAAPLLLRVDPRQ